jgi:hypothetical protein
MIQFHVAHAAWAKDRPAELERMMALPFRLNVVKSVVKEHASVWARRLWEQCLDDGPDWHTLLNDDVDVCPSKPTWDACLSQAKGDIVSLHTSCTERTDVPWVRCYWATGPGYALRRGVARKLLDFVDTLPRILVESVNEDVIMILYAWSKQEPIWSSIPALVEHRVEVPSTLGYDNHDLRQTKVPWHRFPIPDRIDWKVTSQPPFIENPWATSAHLDKQWRAIKSGHLCYFCLANVAIAAAKQSPAGICWDCLRGCVINVLPGMNL